jgi:hypothetical protein
MNIFVTVITGVDKSERVVGFTASTLSEAIALAERHALTATTIEAAEEWLINVGRGPAEYYVFVEAENSAGGMWVNHAGRPAMRLNEIEELHDNHLDELHPDVEVYTVFGSMFRAPSAALKFGDEIAYGESVMHYAYRFNITVIDY